MLRGLALAAIMIAALAFAGWAVMAETGPVAWVNALQMKIFGSYSIKITVLVLTMIVFALVSVLIGLWSAFIKPLLGSKLGEQFEAGLVKHAKALSEAEQKQVTKQQGLVAAIVLLAACWIASGGYYAWRLHQHDVDANAEYFRVDLATGDGSNAAGHDHLSVHGQYVWDATLSFRTGSAQKVEYSLIPIAGRGWKKGDPVPFVAKVDDASNFSYLQRQEADPYTFLAVPAGSVPTTAIGEFEKLGIPISDATRLLRVVPAHGGKPDFERELRGDRMNFWIFAAIGSFFCVAAIIALSVAMLLGRRRAPQGSPA